MKRLIIIAASILLCLELTAQDFPLTKIQYKTGYEIEGVVVKKRFLGEKEITITWNDNSSLSGTLTYDGATALVKGEFVNLTESILGVFAVQNSKNGQLAVKSKLPLEWRPIDVFRYTVMRENEQVELSRSGNETVVEITPLSSETNVSSLSAVIEPEIYDCYGFSAVDSLILNSGSVNISYDNGLVFTGRASFTKGFFQPIPMKGNIKGLPEKNVDEFFFERCDDESSEVRISLIDNTSIESVIFHVPSSSVPEIGTDIPDVIFSLAKQTVGKASLTEGRDFSGNMALRLNMDKLEVQLLDGTVSFGNGDSFEGNVGGKWIANLPVDGTTVFADGSIRQGNWLSGYKLSDNDYLVLSDLFFPSDYLEMATEMSSHNSNLKTFSGRIVEGPVGYYYSSRSLEIEEGTGKYTYYVDNGDRILHGAYSFKLYTYLSSAGKDLISVTGQHYNGARTGEWQLTHKGSNGALYADLRESYRDGVLDGPFTYTFSRDGMKYTFKGQYSNDMFSGSISVTFREGSRGFDLSGEFNQNGWADGTWTLIDRRNKKETVYSFRNGQLLNTTGESRVSVIDVFTDPYESLAQYKKIKNGFKK